MSRTIIYLRVSTQSQNINKNKQELLLFCHNNGLNNPEFVEDIISGSKTWRTRALGSIVSELSEGDNIVVSEISRLGRSTLDIMELLNHLTSNKINVYAVKNGFRLDGTISSCIMAAVLAICAEVERDLIRNRVTEALRVKKQQGVTLGRPVGSYSSRLDKDMELIHHLLSIGVTKTAVSARVCCTPQALHQWLKRHPVPGANAA